MVRTDRVPPDSILDMPPEHDERILNLHNCQSGRIFMLGTGPSLIEQLPLLENLQDEATFGCNTLVKWKELPFEPTYYGVTDIHEPGDLDLLGKLVPNETLAFNVRWPGYYNNAPFIAVSKAHDSLQFRRYGVTGFEDELGPLYTGRTTPLTLIQVAIWMGYREFYFLGIEQSRGYCHEPGATVSGASRRADAFPWDKNPRYRIAIKQCAQRMREDIESHGGQVFDCTPGGLLNVTGKGVHPSDVPAADILPYKDLAEVL